METLVPKSHKSGPPNGVSVVIPRLFCHLKKDGDLPMMSPPLSFFLFHSTLVTVFALSVVAQVQNPTTILPVVSTAFHYTVLKKFTRKMPYHYLREEQRSQLIYGSTKDIRPKFTKDFCLRTCSHIKMIVVVIFDDSFQ